MPRNTKLKHVKKSCYISQSDLEAAEALGFTRLNGKAQVFVWMDDCGGSTKRIAKAKDKWELFIDGSKVEGQGSNNFTTAITHLSTLKPCPGNDDFPTSSNKNTRSPDCMRYTTTTRCHSCYNYRGSLRKQRSREKKSQTPAVPATDISSRVPFATMNAEELRDRCRSLAKSRKQDLAKMQRLKQKYDELITKQAINVPNNIDQICQSKLNTTIDSLPEMTPKRLFLEQQLKAVSAKTATGRRWHPMIVRWSLILHKKSKSAYRYMRESGLICLPAESTLSDYRSYRPLSSGVDTHVLIEASQNQQDVAILIDEMKVSSGLVYNAASGDLVGFVDNTAEDCLDHFLKGDAIPDAQIASHALCFMARGLKSSSQHVVATYATKCLTATQLHNMFWEVVAGCELVGLRVRCCVSDGASTNRKFYDLHSRDFPDDEICYRAINRYAPETDGRVIYFISDSCHLVKTTRNCLENSGANRNTRRLVLHGKYVLWGHISQLVEEEDPGEIRMLHKLTQQHVKLTSYGRMKVRYATQVLSRSVAAALELKHDPQYDSTVEFIRQINDIFDILNITSLSGGSRKLNKFQEKLSSETDWRYKWVEDFLQWLEEWNCEVQQQEITSEEKARCLLSDATVKGWKITCLSFLELTKKLLAEGYDFILTEKVFCQDPLKQFFGKQRDGTGANNNPSMLDVLNYNRLHAVSASAEVQLTSGNCTRRSKTILQVNSEPLPKRQRQRPAKYR